MYIIAGLGNPEKKYEGTRHNAGFEAMDALCELLGVRLMENKFTALTGKAVYKEEKLLLMKPLTYMNRSGDSIAAAAAFYKLPPENVIIMYDDINFEPGRLRVRESGSAGGHNGMKSIIARLGSEDFPRIRIGVGGLAENEDMISHVLGHFSAEDEKSVRAACENAAKAALDIIEFGTPEAMNRYNGLKA